MATRWLDKATRWLDKAASDRQVATRQFMLDRVVFKYGAEEIAAFEAANPGVASRPDPSQGSNNQFRWLCKTWHDTLKKAGLEDKLPQDPELRYPPRPPPLEPGIYSHKCYVSQGRTTGICYAMCPQAANFPCPRTMEQCRHCHHPDHFKQDGVGKEGARERPPCRRSLTGSRKSEHQQRLQAGGSSPWDKEPEVIAPGPESPAV